MFTYFAQTIQLTSAIIVEGVQNQLLMDLSYVLRHRLVATESVCNTETLKTFFACFKMLQGMGSIKRQLRVHVEYADDYYDLAFELETQILYVLYLSCIYFNFLLCRGVLVCLLDGICSSGPGDPITYLAGFQRVSHLLRNALTEDFNACGVGVDQIDAFQDGKPVSKFRCSGQPISVHIPMHRALAIMISRCLFEVFLFLY